MGFDITYHPVARDEITSLYFATLADPGRESDLIQRFAIDDPFYADKLRQTFAEARKIPLDGKSFETGHGFLATIVLGFLHEYHFIRGGAFSFLLEEDPALARYTGDWRELVPPEAQHYVFPNRLTQNYCAGVYLPPDRLQQLRADYEQDPDLRRQMDQVFSHGRLAVFWKAVDQAVAQGMGLLEASEAIVPHPQDLNESTGYSNLYNCEPDGLLLYAEAAKEQIQEALKALAEQQSGSGSSDADPEAGDATSKSPPSGPQRGTILHFDGKTGIISSKGQQYEFTISHWRGDQPPSAGQKVEFDRIGTAVQQVTLLSPADLLREKALQIGEYIRQIAQESYVRAGLPVTIAYGLFALFALFADTIRNIPVTLAGLINGFSLGTVIFGQGFGNGGFGLFLVLVAILSITTPVFWSRRTAWLAYLAPLMVTMIGWYNLLAEFHAISRYVEFSDHHYSRHLMRLITLWLYLTLFATLYLARVGYVRFRRNRPIPPSRVFP